MAGMLELGGQPGDRRCQVRIEELGRRRRLGFVVPARETGETGMSRSAKGLASVGSGLFS